MAGRIVCTDTALFLNVLEEEPQVQVQQQIQHPDPLEDLDIPFFWDMEYEDFWPTKSINKCRTFDKNYFFNNVQGHSSPKG